MEVQSQKFITKDFNLCTGHCKRGKVHADGYYSEEFKPVYDMFRQNFKDGWERQGAAFSVYRNGEKVVDIWGGYADKSCHRLWKEDTLSCGFSTTKSVASICLAQLMEKVGASYEDLVTKYWPEYGQNGKENTTIGMLLGHKAGLAYLEEVISAEDIVDHTKMSAKFERHRPNHAPGAKTAYHVMNHGWLVDQMVRRLDGRKRGVAQYLREEIAHPYGLECYIGLPKELHSRVSRLEYLSPVITAREVLNNPVVGWTGLHFVCPGGVFSKVRDNLGWMGDDFAMFNNPELREAEMPSANGFCTARSLAKLHSLILEGKLLSPSTVEILKRPCYYKQYDHAFGTFESKGYGFMYTRSPRKTWLLGHLGVGGQNVKIDFEEHLAFAYITNAIKAGAGDRCETFMRLQTAVYKCLDKLDKVEAK